MPPEIERQLFVQTIDERRAVLVQERDEADRPLLRVAAGKGERSCVNELPPQRFIAPLRGLNHLAVQRLQIALHALERGARRSLERRVERRDRLNQDRHLRVDGLLRARERVLDDLGNLRFEQLVERRFVLRLQRLERQLGLRQEAERVRVENRRRRAWIEKRHRDAEVLIHAAQLPQIRELVRAGDVADRRKDRVLHDRTQQHVRAEVGGPRRRLLEERRCRKLLIADDESAVLLPNCPPPAIVGIQMEEREAV